MRKHHHPSPAPRPAPATGPSRLPARLDAPLVRRVSAAFGVLSSPTRLRIVAMLAARGEMNVSSLAAALRMRVTAVSNQLRLMAMLGVLSATAEGRQALYAVSATGLLRILEAGARHAAGPVRGGRV